MKEIIFIVLALGAIIRQVIHAKNNPRPRCDCEDRWWEWM